MKKVVAVLTCLLGLIAMKSAIAAELDIVIFRASIDSLSAMDRKNDSRDGTDQISWRAPTKASISVIEVLLGEIRKEDTSVTMYMSAWPLKKTLKDIFFVAKRGGDGSLKVMWWEYSKNGLCVPENVARDLNIADKLGELYMAGKLSCPNLK